MWAAIGAGIGLLALLIRFWMKVKERERTIDDFAKEARSDINKAKQDLAEGKLDAFQSDMDRLDRLIRLRMQRKKSRHSEGK